MEPKTENPYIKHLEKELEIVRSKLKGGDSLVIEDFIEPIKHIAEIFSGQGHSGGSAPYYIGAVTETIKNMLHFKPLSPITGEASEWVKVANNDGKDIYQNNRLSALFKDGEDGQPHYLDAIVWKGEEDYDTFSGTVEGITSRQLVRLPFTPKTFYVDVKKEYYGHVPEELQKDFYEEETLNGKRYYKYVIKDVRQLNEVFNYYDRYNR